MTCSICRPHMDILLSLSVTMTWLYSSSSYANFILPCRIGCH
ncbi:hypothetical protein T11_13976 [Trichinella zimbabwensis]|uniref:Uncharacterized protein n=1 Tax=Trichinella zimbabwensis TaxID=268475 RepID=A0A0V1GQB9_9BILA|nr:hypothetical protein T11_13976 [Trichinella zimbabwensis]